MALLRRILVISLAFSSIFGVAGCGGDKKTQDGSEVKILEFVADRSEIVEGESATLQWSTANAVSVILLENGIRLGSENLPTEGLLQVAPLRDNTYRLEAKGADRSVVSREVTISVAPMGPPVIESFEASPSETRSGNAVALRWRVRRAASVEILDPGGRVLHQDSAAEGEFEVKPSSTSTYELRAKNAYGSVSAEARVEIVAAPRITLAASERKVPYGKVVNLSWEVENATDVYLVDPKGKVLFEGPGENGNID